MDALSSIHPSLNETISWLEWRLDQLEANGEIEASYACGTRRLASGLPHRLQRTAHLEGWGNPELDLVRLYT